MKFIFLKNVGTGPADLVTAGPIFELPSLWAIVYLTYIVILIDF